MISEDFRPQGRLLQMWSAHDTASDVRFGLDVDRRIGYGRDPVERARPFEPALRSVKRHVHVVNDRVRRQGRDRVLEIVDP